MASRSNVWGLAFGLIACILSCATLVVLFMRGHGQAGLAARDIASQRVKDETYASAMSKQDLEELRRRLEALSGSLGTQPQGRPLLETLVRDVEAALRRNEELMKHLEQEAYVETTGSQIASQNLSAAQVVIGGLSVAFAVVLFGATILTALNLHSYKDDADRIAGDIRERADRLEGRFGKFEQMIQATEDRLSASVQQVAEAREQSSKWFDDQKRDQEHLHEVLQGELQQQEGNEARTREFLLKIADIHGSAFSELLSALPTAPAYAEVVTRLRNKGLELQARMDLAHPDPERLWVAISTLAAVGTKIAIPDLARLKEDERVAKKISFHADDAIRQIRERNPG